MSLRLEACLSSMVTADATTGRRYDINQRVQPFAFARAAVDDLALSPIVLRPNPATGMSARYVQGEYLGANRNVVMQPRSPIRSASVGLPKIKTGNAGRTTGTDFLLITQRHESA